MTRGGAICTCRPPPAALAIKVDWQGGAPHCAKAVDDEWAKGYFVKGKEQKRLAELTGLTVRLKK